MTIVAFISQKGGVGKSTLSQALAVEASKQKLKTLLADYDPQQKTCHRRLSPTRERHWDVQRFSGAPAPGDSKSSKGRRHPPSR